MTPFRPLAAVRATQRLIAVLLVCAGFHTNAQTTPHCPPVAEPAAIDLASPPASVDRGFMWRIDKDGRTSYLYGTLHVAKHDWAYPGAKLVSAMKASDVVALELDVLDPAIMQRLVAAMAPRPQDAVDDALKARLGEQIQGACLAGAMLTVYPAEMASPTLC